MCTLTYIPLQGNDFILTHNRDEKITRQASFLPESLLYKGMKLTFPKDKDASGTWFGVNENGRIACILNGAFEKHTPAPPFRMSRGLVVLDALAEPTLSSFFQNYNFSNIDNFTLIILDNSELWEFRWDGEKKKLTKLSPTKTYIWSSVTLYTKEQQMLREKWLNNWINNYKPTPKSLFNFHEKGGDQSPESRLKMSIKNSHQTVSITQVYQNKLERWMNHINFVTNKSANIKLNAV